MTVTCKKQYKMAHTFGRGILTFDMCKNTAGQFYPQTAIVQQFLYTCTKDEQKIFVMGLFIVSRNFKVKLIHKTNFWSNLHQRVLKVTSLPVVKKVVQVRQLGFLTFFSIVLIIKKKFRHIFMTFIIYQFKGENKTAYCKPTFDTKKIFNSTHNT